MAFSLRLRALRSASAFAKLLRRLQKRRRLSRLAHLDTRGPRRSLSPADRATILAKTCARCHICGGEIKRAEPWSADHILAHAHGGSNDIDNFLPAHGDCNAYRRHFGAEEFAWVLRLGVWFRTEICRETPAAMQLAERFVAHHSRLRARQADAIERRG